MGRLCTDWDRGATGYTWIEYFPNIPPASGARSNLGEMRDLAPGARSNLGEILDLAPGAWSNLGEMRRFSSGVRSDFVKTIVPGLIKICTFAQK